MSEETTPAPNTATTVKLSGDDPWMYQYRFYEDNEFVVEQCRGWQPWVTCSKQQLVDIRAYISWGKRYQIRTMLEQHAEGYEPSQ